MRLKKDLRYMIKSSIKIIIEKTYPIIYGNGLQVEQKNKYLSIEQIIKYSENMGYHYCYPFPETVVGLPEGYGKYDLSLIVPVYNVETFIPALMKSLLNQKTDYKYELIFINDGSKDKSLEILNSYSNGENMTIVTQENQGLAAARNKGMKIARGRYYGFVDSDDTITENHVQLMMSKAFETDADIVKGGYCRCYADGHREAIVGEKRSYSNGLKGDVLNYGYAWGAVYKNNGSWSFPQGYLYEDCMIAFVPFMQARRFEYIPEVIYNYNVENLSSLIHQTWRTKTPKCLDHIFQIYASLEFMKKKMDIYNMYILDLVLREVGQVLKSRTGRRYLKVSFELSCYIVNEILLGIGVKGEHHKDEAIEYIKKGKSFKILQACLNRNFIQWEMACWII